MEEEIRQHLDAKRYQEAFELIVGAYQHKVFRLAVAMLGDPARAEEAAQEVFLRAWKSLSGFRGQASVSTWIYAIARNTCLSMAKSDQQHRTLPIEEPAVRQTAESREALAWGRREGPDIRSLMEELPENYRQVLALFYMQEKSYEEVSQILGLPMGTVKTYLHRARKMLARGRGAKRFRAGGVLMHCVEWEDKLVDYNVLAPAERAQVDSHLERCPECRGFLEACGAAEAQLEETYAGTRAPAGFEAAVLDRVRREPAAEQRISWLPEALDFAGWGGVAALAAVVLVHYRDSWEAVPLLPWAIAAGAAVTLAVWASIRSWAALKS